MKTQVIHLDANDDVTSVRDKMSWAKAERILLVFPQRSRILSRSLDLRLLQRHATELGTQMAIVSSSNELRQAAKEINLPAFGATTSARRQKWERETPPVRSLRRREHHDLHQMRTEAIPPDTLWPTDPGFRFSFFSLAVLAILAVLSLFIPSANITLSPTFRQQTLTFSVSADPKTTSVNLNGSLPARLVSMVVEHSKTIQVTGSVAIPDMRAQGVAEFRNLTMAAVNIPAGTVVSTQTNPPIRFITMEDGVIASGPGKTTEIPVQAVEAGSKGNVPTDSLVAFEEENLGTSLSVINPDPMTGGSDRIAAIQTAEDRASVHEALLSEIIDECKVELPKTLSPGDVYFPDTPAVSQILSESYFPAEDQSGDTLSLTIRLQCQAQYASHADIKSLVEMSLDANLPNGFASITDELTIIPASIPKTDADGITRWDVQSQRPLSAQLDPIFAVQLSLGRTSNHALERLEDNLPLSGVPEIAIAPKWWPWMPLIPFRISVKFND